MEMLQAADVIALRDHYALLTKDESWLLALESYVLARGRTRQDNYSALAVWCKA